MSTSPAASPRPRHATQANLSTESVYEMLEAVPFLAILKQDLKKDLVKNSYIRMHKAGAQIVRQGDYGHSMFVLIEGKLRVEVVNGSGQPLVLAQLDRPGMFFGEAALQGRSRRTASVWADSSVVLMEIEKTTIERANKLAQGKLLAELEATSAKRAIMTFLRQHRFFRELSEQSMDLLATQARILQAERGSPIFKEKDADNTVLLVKTSTAKLVRLNPGQDGGPPTESVLSYFNAGDVIGLRSHGERGARLIAMGFVEVIEIDRARFASVIKKDYPDLYATLTKEEDARVQTLGQTMSKRGKTVAIFVQGLMQEGAQEGQSLLTIDLNTCIRCGNCVRACQERHGHARFTRRGKKLVRRAKLEQEGSRQTVLFPASCRHCVNPECMIGCPTGAIHRTPSGEVDIRETCIGCASCANRCPWGNITLVETPDRKVFDPITGQDELRHRLATKCNLCHGHGNANCVHNCPTGAILRVEPTKYWEEIAEVFKDANRKAIGHTDKAPRARVMHLMLAAVSALLGGGLAAVKAYEVFILGGHRAYSAPMLALGFAALFLMLGATALAARRRVANLRVQGGSFLTWTRAHLYMGTLAFWAALLHAGGRFGGTLTASLLMLASGMVATGFFGVFFYKWLPKTITRLEGGAQVEEDLFEEQGALALRRADLLAPPKGEGEGLPQEAHKLAQRLSAQGGALLARYAPSWSLSERQQAAREAWKPQLTPLDASSRATLERLLDDTLRAQDVRAALLLYKVRRAWLLLHIGMGSLLLFLLVAHILGALYFWKAF